MLVSMLVWLHVYVSACVCVWTYLHILAQLHSSRHPCTCHFKSCPHILSNSSRHHLSIQGQGGAHKQQLSLNSSCYDKADPFVEAPPLKTACIHMQTHTHPDTHRHTHLLQHGRKPNDQGVCLAALLKHWPWSSMKKWSKILYMCIMHWWSSKPRKHFSQEALHMESHARKFTQRSARHFTYMHSLGCMHTHVTCNFTKINTHIQTKTKTHAPPPPPPLTLAPPPPHTSTYLSQLSSASTWLILVSSTIKHILRQLSLAAS